MTLEAIKYLQGNTLENDEDMFSLITKDKGALDFEQATKVDRFEGQKVHCKVRASNLNEELGMIDYIFADKTGTLTKNIMRFKNVFVSGHSFGNDCVATTAIEKGLGVHQGSIQFGLAPQPNLPTPRTHTGMSED